MLNLILFPTAHTVNLRGHKILRLCLTFYSLLFFFLLSFSLAFFFHFFLLNFGWIIKTTLSQCTFNPSHEVFPIYAM